MNIFEHDIYIKGAVFGTTGFHCLKSHRYNKFDER